MSETSEEKKEPQKEDQKHYGCIVAVIFTIVAAVTIFAIVRLVDRESGNSDRTLTSRPATYSDIKVTMSGDFSLSAIYYIKPYVDISNLQITMKFYKSNDELIVSKVKTIGNVSEGQEYSIKFGITDFTFSQLMDMTKWNYEVTGGTVSYFS